MSSSVRFTLYKKKDWYWSFIDQFESKEKASAEMERLSKEGPGAWRIYQVSEVIVGSLSQV